MEGKEEDVRLGANKYSERQPIGTAAQGSEDKDYKEPPPAPLFEPGELKSWSFYRAGIAEFMATFLFLYVTILTVMGYSGATSKCASVGIQGIAWSFGGMIFALVYCTAGISGRAHQPGGDLRAVPGEEAVADPGGVLHHHAVPGRHLRRRRGEGVPAGPVHGQRRRRQRGGARLHQGLRPRRRDHRHLRPRLHRLLRHRRQEERQGLPRSILAPLPIGFAVFLVHLATIPITGTGINPARSLGAAIIYNREHAWSLLGRPLHRRRAGCRLPPGGHQSDPVQDQVLSSCSSCYKEDANPTRRASCVF
ncbi:unnamed protein product [Triticum turgidum subsp. durum]|uniref:Aquaporin n=1 Tax=Triticum turgidum subsp. durum TaxID=4567 RepID=A0A9R1RBG6_TRITD|nr:unnamed protein product [Triticum turgidum subsp. durum]